MSTRSIYLLGFAFICLLLAISIYLQFFQGLIPCPLCTLQRLTFALLGLLFLIGLFTYKNRIARLIIELLISASSIMGLSLAGRQVWLQHHPGSATGECAPGLRYMMQVLPVNQVLKKVIAGTADCSQRGWVFMSLNMAEWAIVWFTIFLVGGIYLLRKTLRTRR